MISINDLAHRLAREYKMTLQWAGPSQLQLLNFAPAEGKTLYQLPSEWRFKKDPQDRGLTKQWYRAVPDDTWEAILTNQPWTRADVGSGVQYRPARGV